MRWLSSWSRYGVVKTQLSDSMDSTTHFTGSRGYDNPGFANNPTSEWFTRPSAFATGTSEAPAGPSWLPCVEYSRNTTALLLIGQIWSNHLKMLHSPWPEEIDSNKSCESPSLVPCLEGSSRPARPSCGLHHVHSLSLALEKHW